MKNKTALTLLASLAVVLGFSTPSFADGGAMGSAKSFAGASSAFLVDVPEGALVDGLYRTPKKCWKGLAEAFGGNTDHGLCWAGQQLVGLTVGVPFGVVWGIPTGAFHGGKHGISTGWDKPFSTESYIVTEEK